MLWISVLIISTLLLIAYFTVSFYFLKNSSYNQYGQGYYGNGMMGSWSIQNWNQQSVSGNKLSVDQIKVDVNNYIKGYGQNLEIADIFVFKDTDYYVSVQEKDTGRGAMELLVNPYTGQIYPEYGPNMMWNEKYGMHGRNGMMKGVFPYNNLDTSKRISKEEAVKIADSYVKSRIGKELSVTGDGHEFYGYYTLHIYKNDNTIGMLSVNYYSGEVWYHNWHGVVELEISNDKE